MYHCKVCITFIQVPKELEMAVREEEPLSKFSHEFSSSERLEKQLIQDADLLFLYCDEAREKTLSEILSGVKEKAQVILCTEGDFGFTKDLANVYDVWKLPVTADEVRFRFRNWQKAYKEKTDYWLTKSYLEATINSVPDLIWYKDKYGAHLKVNKSFCKAVNKTMEQIEGRGHCYIWDMDPEEYAEGDYICMESETEVMEQKETCVFEEDVKIGNEIRMFQTFKSPLFDFDGSVMGTVGVGKDVTIERRYEKEIVKRANTDFLTGLYNRRYLYQFMEAEENNALAFYYIDLDNFKSVNDCYGHQEGDRALVLTKEVLEKNMPDALLARIGGDEFLVIEYGDVREEDIEPRRIRLRDSLAEAYAANEEFQRVSASIGTAFSPGGTKANLDKLIEQADTMMYAEKRGKKHQR